MTFNVVLFQKIPRNPFKWEKKKRKGQIRATFDSWEDSSEGQDKHPDEPTEETWAHLEHGWTVVHVLLNMLQLFVLLVLPLLWGENLKNASSVLSMKKWTRDNTDLQHLAHI